MYISEPLLSVVFFLFFPPSPLFDGQTATFHKLLRLQLLQAEHTRLARKVRHCVSLSCHRSSIFSSHVLLQVETARRFFAVAARMKKIHGKPSGESGKNGSKNKTKKKKKFAGIAVTA